MSEPIFREKSLQKVKSPDDLNEYIRVANPSVWMIMAVIILLLIGFCCWAAFGTLQTVIEGNTHCENGVITCYVSAENSAKLSVGQEVTFGDYTGTIAEITSYSGGSTMCTVTANADVPDGIYAAKIIVESIHPAVFLTN